MKKLPSLKIAEARVTEKGGGVYQIEAWVTNDGYLPFPTAMGKRNKIPATGGIITLEGDRCGAPFRQEEDPGE
ncbi:MAG: hypothetical protein MZV63_32405 [Marinilabiliales bacterium]|nr:hypothetical protein [Marinilabiliales bacterium]